MTRSDSGGRFGAGLALPEALARLERWLLPPECLLCREPVPAAADDALICPLCASRWRRIPPPLCGRCGQPTTAGLECRICAAWPGGLNGVRSAVWLDGTARLAVHQLKYEGWSRSADAMARTMQQLAPLAMPGTLVPVPLSPRRLKRRGYNQSACLAQALALRHRLDSRPAVLRRVRHTPTQTALTPEARLANVLGAFAAQGVRGERMILVDDVFTTGATLVAAAAALLEAGAASVEAVTFARALPPVTLN